MLKASTNNYQEVPVEHLTCVLIADYVIHVVMARLSGIYG